MNSILSEDTSTAKTYVSLVIPVYNEEETIDELVRRCVEVCRSIGHPFEVILVNDGSRDTSSEHIAMNINKYPGEVCGIILNRNYGQHAAVLAGCAHSSGEIIVTLDADLQNPPESIPDLVMEMDKGFDVVGSVRTPRHDPLPRKISSYLVNKLVQRVTGVKMHDYGCMLRAYRRSVITAVLSCSEHSLFIPVLANSFALKTSEIEVSHHARTAGTSKYNLWKLISLQFDLLTGMTTFPLRLLSIAGVGMAALGISFGVLLLIMRFIFGAAWAAQGVFTLFAILFLFVGLQFFGMGLLGEYLGRIAIDVRARPRYIVQKVLK